MCDCVAPLVRNHHLRKDIILAVFVVRAHELHVPSKIILGYAVIRIHRFGRLAATGRPTRPS